MRGGVWKSVMVVRLSECLRFAKLQDGSLHSGTMSLIRIEKLVAGGILIYKINDFGCPVRNVGLLSL